MFFNECLFIIKNTELTKEFFSLAINLEKYFENRIHQGLFADGAVICFLLQQIKYNKLYTFLPDYSQGCYASSFNNKYNEDKTFILHNYGEGFTSNQKYELILNLKSNKHWKDINV